MSTRAFAHRNGLRAPTWDDLVSDCAVDVGSTPKTVATTINFTTSSSSLVNVTPVSGPNFAVDLAANTIYYLTGIVFWVSDAGGVGLLMSFSYSGTMSSCRFGEKNLIGSQDGQSTPTLGTAIGSGLDGGTDTRMMLIQGGFTTGTAGTLQFMAACGNTPNHYVVVQSGSSFSLIG